MRTDTSDTAQPLLSVVVIGRNEGARLRRCLESIQGSDWPAERLELIYADTASQDDSVRIAQSLGAQVVAVETARPCAAAGRNAGLARARGELVQFFDGDTVVDPAWLRTGVAAFADRELVCAFGQRRELEPDKNVFHFWANQDWVYPPGPADFCGGDAMFRRAALERVGGYDASLIAGEEHDLAYRLLCDPAARIECLAAPMTLHDIGIVRFGQYWRRGVRSGWAYAEVAARHPGLEAWRRVVRRNLAHLALFAASVVLAGLLRSPWPLVLWAGLIAAGIARDAIRCRAQTRSGREALLYAAHHYLSKLPFLVGHVQFFRARLARSGPASLIEYRSEAGRARAEPPPGR